MIKRLILTTALGLFAFSAYAQQQIIEEIITTAQKREQDVQDVSVAVTAFSGDALEQLGFEEGLDITSQVPNMNYFAIFGEASSPSMTLRGMGLSNFADTWEAPVGLYVDEVYRGNPSGTAIQLFDVERIEVLRGPQGTLFGRNTTAGLVHHVTKDPTDFLETGFSAQFGSNSQMIFEGVASGPLSDSIRGRIAIKKNDDDGWQTNGIDGQELGTTDSLGYRGKIEFDISESASVLFDVHGSSADQQTVGFVNFGYQDPADTATRCSVDRIMNGECVAASIPGAEVSREEAGGWGPEHVSSGAAGGLKTEIDTFGVSAKLLIETDHFDITSITAYETLDKYLEDDFDAVATIWFDEQYGADTNQFSQELRVSGETNALTWVTGVYYFTDERDLFTQGPTSGDSGGGNYWHNEYMVQDTTSYAVFAQMQGYLSDTVALTVGARYTDEEKDADFSDRGESSYYNGFGAGPFISLSDTLEEDGFSGRIGLDYTPNDNTLVYASLSRGFKSGGFNGSYVPNVGSFGPVTKEIMTSWEAGYKLDFAGGRGRMNIAAFTYELQDFQAQLWNSAIGAANIDNLADVKGDGLEAELNYLVTDNFQVIAGLGLLSTELDTDIITTVAGMDIPLDGNEMPSAPGLTYNVVGRYYMGNNWTFQFDYSWQDDHELQLENDPWSKQEAYGVANAKVTWISDNGRYSAAAAINNLTDEEYFTYINTGGSDWGYGVWGAPQTAYIKFSYNSD